MVLKNYSQNKCSSESNVSKNTSKPCVSNFSECRVKNLIQKYEDLSVSAKYNNLQSGIKHCNSEQYIRRPRSEMFEDTYINLNKKNVYRFLSADNNDSNNKYVCNEYRTNGNIPNIVESYSDTKMPSHSKKSTKPNFKLYIDEFDRDRKLSQGSSPSSAKRREDKSPNFLKNFYDPDKSKKAKERKEEYSQSLPNGKRKEENSFGKTFIRSFSATTSRDKKTKPVPLSNSNQQYKLDKKVNTLPKDGSSIVQAGTLSQEHPNTGAIKKQLNSDEIMYRKRRNSYLMATQNEENFRKQKIYPDKVKHNPNQSYVSKTISKFETQSDIMTVVDVKSKKPKSKFEHDIKQLFQQYHDNKRFGTSNKMTREELSLEIDNVLLNKFKQISSDNAPEVSGETSAAGNHSNSHQNIDSTPQNSEQDEIITLIVEQPEKDTATEIDIQTDYVIIVREVANETPNGDDNNVSQGQSASKLNLESTDSESESELNVREKLNTQLTKVLSRSNLKNSIENLCDDIENDLNVINQSLSEIGVEITNVSVIDSDDENMFANIDHYRSVSCPNNLNNKTEERIYENLKYIQEKIQERKETEQQICDTEITLENTELVLRESEETRTKRKVSNLVSFFTEIIQDISSDSRRTTLDRKSTSLLQSNEQELNDVFEPSPERNNEEFRYCVSTTEANHIQKDSYNLTYSSDTSSSSTSTYEDNIYDYTVNLPTDETSQTVEDNVDDIQNSNACPLEINIENEQTSSSQRSSLYRRSFRNDASSEDTYENMEAIRTLSVHIQAEQLKNELHDEEMKGRQNSVAEQEKHLHQISEEVVEEVKPILSRLYSGKFLRNQAKQDTNNNECIQNSQTPNTNIEIEDQSIILPTNEEPIYDELVLKASNTEDNVTNNINLTDEPKESNDEIDKNIYDIIKEDTLFFSDSDSEGEYDLTETCNYGNDNFISLQRKLSTSEWVNKTRSRIEELRNEKYDDFDENEDTEHIYERIKRSGSSGTLCTIYDEQNNPAIRFSMLDITGDLDFTVAVQDQSQDKKMEEAEKELRKNIEEIQDNSKKACLINELITTEKNYINKSLHRLVHDYMPEMDKADIPKGLVGKNRQIFGNADIIYQGHKDKFLPELEKYTCIEDIAKCFLNHETIFKLYPLYSKNKPKSDVALRDYGAFFKARQDALSDKLDLASYLLTPIQRLAKYCLLVKSLVKECEKENIACESLKGALEMLNKQMRMGNDLIALDSIVNYNGNIRDQGEVLLRDTFMVQPPNKKPAYEGMLFLFQECLIITSVHRQDFFESFLYRESFQLTDMGYSDIESEPMEFSVWYRKRDIKMYRFRTKNLEVKQKWVKEIFNLLWKQLEANKRRRKKELEENGVKDTRVPVVRPYSVPNKTSVKRKDSGSSTKKSRKTTFNSSADTIWYTKTNT